MSKPPRLAVPLPGLLAAIAALLLSAALDRVSHLHAAPADPSPATAASTAGAQPAPMLPRRPDIQGDQVVFTCEGDLWLGSLSAGTAMRITAHDGVEGPAFFSPDGRTLAFTAQYDGATDVYVMDVAGGAPRRLTWDPRSPTVLGFSPDGREVIFRTERATATWRGRAWAVPVGGGPARLLPLPSAEFATASPDGRRIAYVPFSAEWQHWKRYRGGQADDVWLADTLAHTWKRLTTDPGVDTTPEWLGDAIVIVSERDGHANLWRIDPATTAATQLTRYNDYDVRYPATDGRRVIFEHGRALALYDPATGEARDLRFDLRSDRVHARERRVPALRQFRGIDLGPTGKRVLVSARGQVLSAPVDKGDVRAVAVQAGGRCQSPAWSEDGKHLAFVSDATGEEQVWIAPASGGPPRQVTKDHRGPLGVLVWSPDGRWIATSDREMRILLVDVASSAITTVDQADRGGSYDVNNTSYRFSPDSRWLAFARIEPNWNQAVHLYEIAGKRKVAVSDPGMNSFAPAFDAAGKHLYFLSDRGFQPRYTDANRFFTYEKYTRVSVVPLARDTPSPFLEKNEEEGATGADSATAAAAMDGKDNKGATGTKGAKGTKDKAAGVAAIRVDTDGIRDRIVDVPVPGDRYRRVESVEDRLLLMTFEDAGLQEPFAPANQLRAFDMKKKEVTVLVDRMTSFDLSADRKKLLIQKQKEFNVVDASTDAAGAGKGKVATEAWTLTVDPAAEWRQVFHETWRLARDFFYDPGMHGVDWEAVRRKYEAILPAVADRSDLTFLQGQMVAELNCGHAYVRGGDLPAPPPVPMGWLGADLTLVPGATPAYRVNKVYPGDGFDFEAQSPLAAPGVDVRAGDYILAVGGVSVRADLDLQALLAGTGGQVVRLTVNRRASRDGAREVWVKPMADEGRARYYDWVAGRRDYVRKHGGADLGYVHLPNMIDRGLEEWGKHYYPNLNAAGMIYDVRYNGGGYIDAMILMQMSHRPYSYFKPRYGVSWTRQDWGFPGHSVALCNEQSYSDAEEFADAFQRLKLGPVIGVPTWGGEVGSGGGYPLLDGGSLYIPNYAEWTPDDGWVIEGTGALPDIVVEDDPAQVMAGRDPQLDRAIEYLREKIKAQPVAWPTPPAYPNKAKGAEAKGQR